MNKYDVDITLEVLTPKGKAEKSSKTFAKRFPSILDKKPTLQIMDDSTFRITFHNLNDKQINKLMTKCNLVEIGIKGFYKKIIKIGNRVNKLGTKFKWGTEKIKRRFAKEYKKAGAEDNKFEQMTKEEFKDFINFEDLEEIKALLEKDLVNVVEFKGND